ncbi:MAG: glucose 1-dehydrogenase [Chloroflexota bacterium]
MTGKLQNKITIVTGASRGIGWGIAQQFAEEGATVIVASRSEPPKERPEAILWHSTDVSSGASVTELIDFTLNQFGRIDVLVNNAGVQLEKTIVDTSDDEWHWLMDVNVTGVFLCCRKAIEVMQKQGGGVIINLGSIAATNVDHSMAIYNASKGFVHSLTRSIAVDHGRDGIRCNAICPGWIMTDLAEQAFDLADDPESARQNAIARHPVGRMGTPADIASMAVWLASDESAFATGQFFTVDGGLTAGSPIHPGLL